ncbi:hypothetical protein E8E14_007989 [Neopestalotiopsis sp. 37M]|nr:hypothetical protein E8E14_007989 [Neopestalotiopsis sp. 37M]
MPVRTRFLVISDTHGQVFDVREGQQADVVIHCGDLTEESKIDEFRTTIDLLRQLPAPLKLVIAGNHDLTLDEPTFKKRLSEAPHSIEPDLVVKNFGNFGEPRRLFDEAKDAGIIFLDEGNHEFILPNGAMLRLYAIGNKFDDETAVNAKAQKALECVRRGFCSTSHCSNDTHTLHPRAQTLFVNASIEGRNDELPSQPPWIVDIELPEAEIVIS